MELKLEEIKTLNTNFLDCLKRSFLEYLEWGERSNKKLKINENKLYFFILTSGKKEKPINQENVNVGNLKRSYEVKQGNRGEKKK